MNDGEVYPARVSVDDSLHRRSYYDRHYGASYAVRYPDEGPGHLVAKVIDHVQDVA